MLQDPVAKPPDHLDLLVCSRATVERRQKANSHPEQPIKCPRCDSTNTKFCYYNNYSATQPRHFCKNCRRYWTKGGALRNVPIGGGCRKNKRLKQRTVDPTSLVSLDETTSNVLASINRGNCSSLLSSLSGPSTSTFPDLSNASHRFGLIFSRLQESLRSGEPSGAYGLGIGSGEIAPELLRLASCSQPSLISTLPSFDANLMSLGFASSMVKPEHDALYGRQEFGSLLESQIEMTGPTTAATTTIASSSSAPLTSLPDHLSPYNVPAESFNGEAQVRHHSGKLALQLVNDGQNGDEGKFLPNFEDETKELLRRMEGKSVLSTLPEWQQMNENYYETAADSQFWNNNIGWAEFQALASSAGASML